MLGACLWLTAQIWLWGRASLGPEPPTQEPWCMNHQACFTSCASSITHSASIKHGAPSIKHRISNIKHHQQASSSKYQDQASSIKHQASSIIKHQASTSTIEHHQASSIKQQISRTTYRAIMVQAVKVSSLLRRDWWGGMWVQTPRLPGKPSMEKRILCEGVVRCWPGAKVGGGSPDLVDYSHYSINVCHYSLN